MRPLNRRQFVASTAVSLGAIAGCLDRSNGGSGDGLADDLTGSLATGLDALPTSVGDASIRVVYVNNEPATSDGNTGQFLTGDPSTIGLERSQLECVVTGIYGDSFDTIQAYVGSFDASDVDAPDGTGVSSGDGIALRASGTRTGWSDGLEAARAAKGDPGTGIDGDYSLGALFSPMADAEIATSLFDASGASQLLPDDAGVGADAVRAVGAGLIPDVEAREQTTTYVVLFSEDASPTAGAIDALVRGDDYQDVAPSDVEVTTDDRRAITTFTHDLPRSQLPDNSPDAYFTISYDGNSSVATISNRGGDAVDAANLELRVDGEEVDAPWASDATIERGASYEIEASPLSFVRVVWTDPNLEGVAHSLGHQFLDARLLFERSYDPDADELTITYTRDQAPDPDGFLVDRIESGFGFDSETALSEYVDSLESGTEIVLSDVEYGDTVQLSYTPDPDASFDSVNVLSYSADPPGAFELVEEAGTRELVFRGRTSVDSSNVRVLVDGAEADRQWTDVAETLAGGERLAVEAGMGTTVSVDYVEEDNDVEVFRETVLPTVQFSYDAGESAVEITHDGGEAVPAADLAVQFDSPQSKRSDAFSGEYETVEAGGSITVEYPDDGDRPSVVVVLYQDHALDTEYVNLGSIGGGNSDDTAQS